MIARLRKRLLTTLMLMWTAVVLLLVGGINLVSARVSDVQNDNLLLHIAESGGRQPPLPASLTMGADSALGEMRVFSVRLDRDGNVLETLGASVPSDIPETADELLSYVRQNHLHSGRWQGYRYVVTQRGAETLIAFMDQRAVTRMRWQFVWVSLGVGLVSLAALFVLSRLMVRRLVHPVEEGFERQKRFISDAGHELKTPLSVLSINAQALQGEIGENRYLTYITSETERMNGIVSGLLSQARLDGETQAKAFAPVDWSQVVLGVALPFESQAFEEGKTYETHIQPGITVTGDAEGLGQLAAILIDNALKHSPAGSRIDVTMKKDGEKAVLAVSNTGSVIAPQDRERIFERFYRTDESRSKQTGGYGLGLSIARGIAQAHHGTLIVDAEMKDGARFVVTL